MFEKATEYIKEIMQNKTADTAIILGSGLGGLVNSLQNKISIPYEQIPGFPRTTVSGHAGCFIIGDIGKHTVLCMQGRFHIYEDIAPQLFVDLINMFKNLGVSNFIATNASGSLRADWPAGSIVLLKDHINFSGRNPLIGEHEEPYFPDMSETYTLSMRQRFISLAQQYDIEVYEGIYLMVLGPNYETASEIRLFRQFGADVVGMSTVPEVIAAVHANMKVLSISVVANLGTGLSTEQLGHDDVLRQVNQTAEKVGFLLQKFLEQE